MKISRLSISLSLVYPPSLCEGWMVALLLSSKCRACVVAREKVTPVTLVCGRLEEERKTVF
jgi:hypothetical protein